MRVNTWINPYIEVYDKKTGRKTGFKFMTSISKSVNNVILKILPPRLIKVAVNQLRVLIWQNEMRLVWLFYELHSSLLHSSSAFA